MDLIIENVDSFKALAPRAPEPAPAPPPPVHHYDSFCENIALKVVLKVLLSSVDKIVKVQIANKVEQEIAQIEQQVVRRRRPGIAGRSGANDALCAPHGQRPAGITSPRQAHRPYLFGDMNFYAIFISPALCLIHFNKLTHCRQAFRATAWSKPNKSWSSFIFAAFGPSLQPFDDPAPADGPVV